MGDRLRLPKCVHNFVFPRRSQTGFSSGRTFDKLHRLWFGGSYAALPCLPSVRRLVQQPVCECIFSACMLRRRRCQIIALNRAFHAEKETVANGWKISRVRTPLFDCSMINDRPARCAGFVIASGRCSFCLLFVIPSFISLGLYISGSQSRSHFPTSFPFT